MQYFGIQSIHGVLFNYSVNAADLMAINELNITLLSKVQFVVIHVTVRNKN